MRRFYLFLLAVFLFTLWLSSQVPVSFASEASATPATSSEQQHIYLPHLNVPAATAIATTATTTPTETSALPTPTTAPTLTNTPIPTPEPLETVLVLPGTSMFVDSLGYIHIVGQVRNSTSDNIRFVKIVADLFNAQGQLLDTDYTYTYESVVAAGQTACFQHIFTNGPALQDIASTTFEIDFNPEGQEAPGLVLLNVSGAYNETFEEWYEIIGQVSNSSATQTKFVKVVGTLFSGPDQSGAILDCDFTYVNSRDLEPGQTSSFKLTFVGSAPGIAGSYSLAVEGSLP